MLVDPLPDATRALLRRAVLDHAYGERRRRHPSLVHLGSPGGLELVVPAPQTGVDHSLRVDVVAALLRRHDLQSERDGGRQLLDRRDPRDSWVWLTRSGPLDLQDVDVAWATAALAATSEAGCDLTMVVVTRHGWRDPRSGLSVSWARIRRRASDLHPGALPHG